MGWLETVRPLFRSFRHGLSGKTVFVNDSTNFLPSPFQRSWQIPARHQSERLHHARRIYCTARYGMARFHRYVQCFSMSRCISVPFSCPNHCRNRSASFLTTLTSPPISNTSNGLLPSSADMWIFSVE
ncbi:hypothetical protein BT69DRAFT_195989 [Atractiella rhizophila]|nr:hypothetical protein BT69DRAFT_195989 [Atractiella rhizophila]